VPNDWGRYLAVFKKWEHGFKGLWEGAFCRQLAISVSSLNSTFVLHFDKALLHTADPKIIDVRYHDFNGVPVVNWY
jgi:hypothetical protein